MSLRLKCTHLQQEPCTMRATYSTSKQRDAQLVGLVAQEELDRVDNVDSVAVIGSCNLRHSGNAIR